MINPMLSRRSLLRTTALTVVPAAWSQPSRTAASPLPPDQLPPSILALSSLASQARPFTNQERAARLERARRLMTSEKIDAVILPGGTSSRYFANIQFGGSERLWALVLPVRGRPYLVCPAFEESRAHEMLAGTVLAGDTDVITWEEDQSPYEALLRALRERQITQGRLGVEETMRFVFADTLASTAGQAFRVVSATPVVGGCRIIKEPHEIDCLRLAGKATLQVYEAVYKSLKEGMTQRDVGALIQAGYTRVGFPGEASLNIGEYTASPHGSRTPQMIREGTILMLDDGCRVEGYTSDITRTFVLGKPTEKMQKVFRIVRDAQRAALAAAKPGVANAAVDAAARKVIVDAGYGPGYKFFTHRVGHGMGMDMHEWSYLVKNNMYGWPAQPTLAKGMVFSDEPGVYIPGEFGVRLEDDLHVTEDGAELLTPASPSLEHPFA